MYIIYLLIAIIGVSEVASVDRNSDAWILFKSAYNRRYNNDTEEQYRRTVFENNSIKINQHNLEAARGLHSYHLKMNIFGDMTHEEFIRTVANGFKASVSTEVSSAYDRHTYLPPSNVAMPPTVGAVTTVIEDQGQCGSCWAFTATGALEGQHFIKTGKLVRLSAQNLMDCTDKYGNAGCCGGSMGASFQYIKENKGIDTEGFIDLQSGNETTLQIAIATVGPISVAVDSMQPSFQFYSSGVYDEPKCSSTQVSHSFILVGYDTYKNGTKKQDYYIAKNSWGESWGNKGSIWMSRNKHNQCGIANIGSYPLV